MDELRQIYFEPTSLCNLNCIMCSRRYWENQPEGHMNTSLFDKVIDEMPDSVTRIFFGGIGEPLYHPDILYMIKKAKDTGRRVEIITNGTLLDREMSGKLVDLNLDMLWLSLDGVEEESYEGIRSGASFSQVMDNLRIFNEKRFKPYSYASRFDDIRVKLGISFILMKKSIPHFKKLFQKAQVLGVAEIKASHLIPYDESQVEQICYERIIFSGMYNSPDLLSVRTDIPFMDMEDIKQHDILPLITNPLLPFSIMGSPLYIKENYCRFIQEGITFVRWDGEVCPCMATLHENIVYQQGTNRHVYPAIFGNACVDSLSEIWEGEEYAAFRKRVLNYEFSPCVRCDPFQCDLFQDNKEDCSGNPFPTCGACLWAQGLIQCP